MSGIPGTSQSRTSFVGAVQTESFTDDLALESSMAWIAVVAGAVTVLAALAMPRVSRTATTVVAR
jgi:hypothetical protein